MAYVDELVEKGEAICFNYPRSIITDRMGPWSEQNVKLAWVGRKVLVTPDEAEVLFEKGLTKNVVRYEDGTIYMEYVYCVASSFDGAIVCGVLAPSTKAELRPEILEYAKKMGYVADEMTPVKMASGTKSLIFNADGTYNVFYSWHDSVLSNIERGVLEKFTKNFFRDYTIEIKNNGVLMVNLSEDEAFSRKNIDHFRDYDIQLIYLSKEYDKDLLLYALLKRVFIYDPYNTLGRGEFKKLGNVQIPANPCNSLTFNEFGKVHMSSGKLSDYSEHGYYDYTYVITVPYSESIRELMVDTEKLLKKRFGTSVRVDFSGFRESISVTTNDKALIPYIQRELLALDYAITLWRTEAEFNSHQLRYSILSLLQSDSTGRYQFTYHSYMQLFKVTLPEKYKNISI